MTQQEVSLLLSWVDSYGLDWVFKHRRNMLGNALSFLSNEVDRLKAGNFTPDEFQNFCGDCTVQDGFESFVQGCRTYQKQLFNGRSDGPNAMFCEHANEVPAQCPCRTNFVECYCMTHTCKDRNENGKGQSV